MLTRSRGSVILALTLTAIFVFPNGLLAQLRVITSGGFSSTLQDVLPEFQKTTGIVVTVGRGPSQGAGTNTIRAQLRRGVPADVVIMSREGLNELIAESRIVDGTDKDLARTPLGVSVRAGAPRPDVSTVEGFKLALLRAKSIASPNSTTGIYMTTRLFPQLGIANQVAAKMTSEGVAAVSLGEAEITVQPMSELLHVPGVDFVGTIPSEIQYLSVFSAAVVTGSKESVASKRLIAFLSSDVGKNAMKNNGMEPLARQ
jgi:molybdate transport system substrate-binding protein